ncbi:MAG: bifunctional riboflavin kinase/FAD synthetase [Pseudomonadota bacterium]
MRVIRSTSQSKTGQAGCVLTIGNFDAIHLGHQAMLERTRAIADHLSLPLVLMTFDPTPEEYFRGDAASPRVNNFSSRFFALRKAGVDVMLCMPFDAELAQTDAGDFVDSIVVRNLNAKALFVGDDFRFGKNRLGDFNLLKEYADQGAFSVESLDTVTFRDERISSSRVRAALSDGDLDLARSLLGRSFSISGRVTRGQQLGRQWGFPTLNIPMRRKPVMTGVFAVSVRGVVDDAVTGVANLGNRPTVDGFKTVLEVHLFDFNEDIYGKRVCVDFVSRIRGERKFDDFDALKKQIKKDAERARELLLEADYA